MSKKLARHQPSPRLVAATELITWINQKNAADDWRLPAFEQMEDSFSRHLLFTSIRFFSKYTFFIEQLTGKHISKLDPEVVACLLIGLTQLEDNSHVSEYAAVNETVNLVSALGKPYIKGYINANLRSFLRKKEALHYELSRQPLETRTSHPKWMIDRWKKQYGEKTAIQIAEANNHVPKVRVIVNPELDYPKLREDMAREGYTLSEIGSDGFTIDNPHGLFGTQWVETGAILVQDTSSQAIASLVSDLSKTTILDACASPGGKLIHLEWQFGKEIQLLVASDISAGRIQRLSANLERSKSKSVVIQMDARQPSVNRQFDLVLVDAPCGSSGTIQKHPGIKWRRRASDFVDNHDLQVSILQGLRHSVKIEGHILYATCSLEREENEAVIESFLSQNGASFDQIPFSSDRIEKKWMTSEGYFQRLPDQYGMGLFAALLKRRC